MKIYKATRGDDVRLLMKDKPSSEAITYYSQCRRRENISSYVELTTEVVEGSIYLVIPSEVSKGLNGYYYFDIEQTLEGGLIQTIERGSILIIQPDTTKRSND
ncbi:hypothetical protein EI427_11470 [Flammeovirga pectinis]|uniref:Uncharacterized protein n=1 Tax=Flammeovirga pectinis TaxID=2494373 RepID=A0A3Q9FLG4_9BACT|nr:hypothetical protein [Flammeovirga pectinis]AZQ62830.1 hypothetical protein EI427_11470 [Flammeovirga pectinis]